MQKSLSEIWIDLVSLMSATLIEYLIYTDTFSRIRRGVNVFQREGINNTKFHFAVEWAFLNYM
jgi:hypothetical protein